MKYHNRERFMDLADKLEQQENPDYAGFIMDLRDLEFDDFANEKYATPKLEMIRQATELGLHDVVRQIKDGDFDQ